MNAHLSQSIEAAIELSELVALPRQIISVRENKPAILPVQDAAVGVNRLTRPDVTVTPHEMMNLMMWNRQFKGTLPVPAVAAKAGGAGPQFSGAQVVSQLLAPINVEMKNKMYDDDKDDPKKFPEGSAEQAEALERNKRNLIKIRQGVIEQGMLDKDAFGKGTRGIIHLTYNYYGQDAAVNLLDSLQSTVSLYLVMRGFSVGISDLIADNKTREDMVAAIEKRKAEIEVLIQKLHSDMLETHAGTTRAEEFERKMFSILNQATDDAGKIGQRSLADTNRMINMVRAGSKGNQTNVSQMVAVVGQQNVEGKRVPYGFTDRTLPHFKRYDDGARARGFVENSFIAGLSPEEFFFHAMSGREGLIDTAVKTADTGYIQRQLVKAMEDLVVHHDFSVRDAAGCIIQYAYGEDRIAGNHVETQDLKILQTRDPIPGAPKTLAAGEPVAGEVPVDDLRFMGFKDLLARYGWSDNEKWDEFLTPETARALKTDKTAIPELNKWPEAVRDDQRIMLFNAWGRLVQDSVFYPVNLSHLLTQTSSNFNLDRKAKTDLNPLYVVQTVKALLNETGMIDPRSGDRRPNLIFAALMHHYCSPKRIVKELRFTRKAWDYLVEAIRLRHADAVVQPGEMVGVIAAQSIGEPSTQMTLNTYRDLMGITVGSGWVTIQRSP